MRRLFAILLLLAGSLAAGPKTITIGGKKIHLGPASGIVVAKPLVEFRDIKIRPGKLANGKDCTVATGVMRVPFDTKGFVFRIRLHVYSLAMANPVGGRITLRGIATSRGAGVPAKFYVAGPALPPYTWRQPAYVIEWTITPTARAAKKRPTDWR